MKGQLIRFLKKKRRSGRRTNVESITGGIFIWFKRRWRINDSDYVFEAVGGVTGQRHASATTAQVLAVRPLHVDVPLLLLTAAASLQTTLMVAWIRPEHQV